MKITQDVREYARSKGIGDAGAALLLGDAGKGGRVQGRRQRGVPAGVAGQGNRPAAPVAAGEYAWGRESACPSLRSKASAMTDRRSG